MNKINEAIDFLAEIILGKEKQLKMSLACMLSKGHLLIDDVPGVGKTTLALALAKLFGLQFHRVQFTSDLLPSDILGVSIYEPQKLQFTFHPGPIFSQLVLADEVNRASPKTQSALLEAMEEHQVTIEGETKDLPYPFFVVATQNPSKQIGTFPLPESQLDRFLVRISMGYPDSKAELELLQGKNKRDVLQLKNNLFTPQDLIELQQKTEEVHTSNELLRYIMALVQATRSHQGVKTGLSPRGAIALKRMAQSWAFIHGRNHVIPDDVQDVFKAVVEHRLPDTNPALMIVEGILSETKIP